MRNTDSSDSSDSSDDAVLRRREMLQWAAAAGLVLSGTACGGSAGSGSGAANEPAPATPPPPPPPAPAPEPIAPSLSEFTPENQAATFRNVDRLSVTREIARAGTASALPKHARSMLAFRYSHQGTSITPEDYMARYRVSGWLVLKNGEIATERYGMGNTESARWISFSLAKSVTATLVGAALHDGSLDSLDRRCETILPALRGGGYEGTTVRQLLRMTSGVRWSEDYQDPNSDVGRFGQAVVLGRPGAVLEFVASRPRAAAPGTRFNYSTGETFVLGAIVSAVTGTNLSQYLSARFWSRLGMEAAGYWMLDAPGGQELAGGAFSATLRDYGRLALLVLRDGVIDGQRVLPVGWRDLAGRPDTPLTAPGVAVAGYPLGYGYQWWSFPSSTASVGQGIYGQFMYLNPAEHFASIVWSAWLQPNNSAAELETYSLLAGAVDWLR